MNLKPNSLNALYFYPVVIRRTQNFYITVESSTLVSLRNLGIILHSKMERTNSEILYINHAILNKKKV